MIRAIAIDTNAFPKGRYSAQTLELWSKQAQKRHLEIWIAEPILWELMEHAAADVLALEAAVKSKSRLLRQAGFPTPIIPEIPDPLSAVEDAIRTTPGVIIVPLTESAAREALMDQILVRPPGQKVELRSPREGRESKARTLKTGASDSAWIRAIHDHAAGSSDSYVVVSQDADVPKTYEALGWDHPLVLRDFHALRTRLHQLRPDEGEALVSVVRFLDRLASDVSDDPHAARPELDEQVISFGNSFHFPADVADALGTSSGIWTEPLSEEERITRITAPVSVSGVELDPEVGVAYARVTVQGDIERTSWMWDDQADQLTPNLAALRGVLLHAPMTFNIEDGEVVSASNDGGEIWVSSPIDAYHEPTDALDAVLEVLGEYTDDEIIGTEFAEVGRMTIPGRIDQPLELIFEGDLWEGEWQILVQSEDSQLEIACSFDVTLWVGGKEGGFIDPPYILSTMEGNYGIGSPTGRLANFLMHLSIEGMDGASNSRE